MTSRTRRWVTGWLLVATLSLFAAAPAGQTERLREAIRLPQVNFGFGASFSSADGLEAFDPPQDLAGEIRKLEQSLKGSVADVETYDRIARLQARRGDGRGATNASDKALSLLKTEQKAHPEDALAMARLGYALPSDEWPEAERLLRRAVEKSPDDWQCQLLFGKALLARWMTQSQLKFMSVPNSIQIEGFKQLDRAVTLAGDKATEPRIQRAIHNQVRAMGQNLSAGGTSTTELTSAAGWAQSACDDLRAVEQLTPEDFRVVAMRLMIEAIMGSLTTKGSDGQAGQLADTSRRSVETGLQTLVRMAGTTDDRRKGAAIWEAMGVIYFTGLKDEAGVERCVDRSLQLDPNRKQAWDMKFAMLAKHPGNNDLKEFLNGSLQKTNSARLRILLAKVHDRAREFDQAESQVAAALKLEPENLLARASQAAQRLRRAQTEDEAQEVKASLQSLMQAARALDFRNDDNRLLLEHIWTTDLIRVALWESVGAARERCALMKGQIPEGPYFKAVEAALAQGEK